MAEEKTEIQVQQAIIEILQDCIEHNKKIVKRQSAIIILLSCLLFGSFCYYEWSFKAFMSQYDYSNTITETTNDNKTYSENSSINANISDIKVNSDKK